MEFSIGPQFSREFTFQETSLIFNRLNNDINLFFKDREYSSNVKKIDIGYLCVSKGFEPFFMPRPLKILRKEPAIEYELKVDFDTVYQSNNEERMVVIYSELLRHSKEIMNSKKNKNFDTDRFLTDLEEFIKLKIVL